MYSEEKKLAKESDKLLVGEENTAELVRAKITQACALRGEACNNLEKQLT